MDNLDAKLKILCDDVNIEIKPQNSDKFHITFTKIFDNVDMAFNREETATIELDRRSFAQFVNELTRISPYGNIMPTSIECTGIELKRKMSPYLEICFSKDLPVYVSTGCALYVHHGADNVIIVVKYKFSIEDVILIFHIDKGVGDNKIEEKYNNMMRSIRELYEGV